MNILVTNDDGIQAEGIRRLVRTLSEDARIYVAAPHIQRSSCGHSISVAGAMEAREVAFDHAALALEITGTPADCVKLGLKLLGDKGIEIDMVFSGINHGANLGTDTLYSGTVAAAREGCFCGKPSVAVSVDNHFPTHFESALELALRALRSAYGKLDQHTVLNINAPNLPKAEVKGLKVTRLGRREYDENFAAQKNAAGVLQYRYVGEPVVYENLPNDIDVIAMQEGYATITPLQYDLTNYQLLEKVKGWGI